MKQQIARLSPHQNAKVLGVITALNSLLILVPIMLLTSVFRPAEAPPALFLVALPLLYFVIGYVMAVIACTVYNFMYRFIGGVEFETQSADT